MLLTKAICYGKRISTHVVVVEILHTRCKASCEYSHTHVPQQYCGKDSPRLHHRFVSRSREPLARVLRTLRNTLVRESFSGWGTNIKNSCFKLSLNEIRISALEVWWHGMFCKDLKTSRGVIWKVKFVFDKAQCLDVASVGTRNKIPKTSAMMHHNCYLKALQLWTTGSS